MNCVVPHGVHADPNDKDAVAGVAVRQFVLHNLVIYLGLIPLDFTDSWYPPCPGLFPIVSLE